MEKYVCQHFESIQLRLLLIFMFWIWLGSSIAVLPRIDLGLEQELSMPDNSYMMKYFHFIKYYLAVGPPVFFVLNNTHAK